MEFICPTFAKALQPVFQDFGWKELAYTGTFALSTACSVAGYRLIKSPKFLGGLCRPISKYVVGTQVMSTCLAPVVHSGLKIMENMLGANLSKDDMEAVKPLLSDISGGALMTMYGSTTALLLENCYCSWMVHYDGNGKSTLHSRLMGALTIALLMITVCAFNPPFMAMLIVIWFLQGFHAYLFVIAERRNNKKSMTPYEVLAEAVHIEEQERRQAITFHIVFIGLLATTLSTGFYLIFSHKGTDFHESFFFFPMIAMAELPFLFGKMNCDEPCQPAFFTVLCNKFPKLARWF